MMNPYPGYKLSSMKWLEHIPTHWSVERGKRLLQKMERPTLDTDDIVTCFRDGVVTLRKNRRTDGFTESLQEIGYQGIRAGDLVIHAMDAFAGAVGVSDSDGKGTPVYSVCKPESQANAYYYAYAIREMARSQWIVALAKGVRERSTDFRYTALAAEPLPVPPLPEQTTIVHYLDHADSRIQRYISAKERLIELLTEQKQAIINQAVTCGLYPNVRLKPSGVEWLGDVPTHWEIVALRYLATKFGSGVTPRGGASVYQEKGVPFLRSQNVHFAGLRLENVARITRDLHNSLSGTHVRRGDVLLNITGASIGRVCTVPDDFLDGNVNQHVCIIRPRRNVLLPGFLAAFLSTLGMQREIQMEQSGASREGLTLDSIRTFKIVLPPVEEQCRIIHEVSSQISCMDEVVGHTRRQIELMQEYRTRLIADVVTGKLDVREAAAQLPDEDAPVGYDGLMADSLETADAVWKG